jgi:hypothetical protein
MSKALGNYMLVNHRLVHVHLIMRSYNFDGHSFFFSMSQVRVFGCSATKCSFVLVYVTQVPLIDYDLVIHTLRSILKKKP